MTIARSTGSRFVCYKPPIEMIIVQKPMKYHNLDHVYETRLEPVTNGTNMHSVSAFSFIFSTSCMPAEGHCNSWTTNMQLILQALQASEINLDCMQ